MWQGSPTVSTPAGISKPIWDSLRVSSTDLKSTRDGMLLLLSPMQRLPMLRLEGTTEHKHRAARLLQQAQVLHRLGR